MRAPTVDKCANQECPHHFRKIGQGKLYVFPVSDPKAWGLPGGLRQKVVWLCESCKQHYYVRLDRTAHTAIVVTRREHKKHLGQAA